MCKTILQRVRLKASPADIYRLLTDAAIHKKYTGRSARLGQKAGEPFSTESGRITGINVDLAPGQRVVRAWRDKAFPKGVYSMAAFVLTPTPSGTELKLTHRGVPKDLIPRIEREWKSHWEQMKTYLQR